MCTYPDRIRPECNMQLKCIAADSLCDRTRNVCHIMIVSRNVIMRTMQPSHGRPEGRAKWGVCPSLDFRGTSKNC